MTKAEERALEAYPVKQSYNDYYGDYEDVNIVERISFQEGYEQAEKDILSKITPEHIAGLKWIGNTGISCQPYPYHKYCKDLLKTLEELLKQ